MLKPNCARIRAARKRKKWTQTDLADAAGIAMRVVQDAENERLVEIEGRRFSRNSIECLAGALELPIDDIVFAEHEAVQPAGWLMRYLNRSKEVCESKNQKFFTAHELLALLRIPGGAAEHCFKKTGHWAIVSELETRLNDIFPPSDSPRFADFDWRDRLCYRLALDVARVDGRATDKHYLLAILTQTPSAKTIDWLKRRLGETEFDELVSEVKTYPGDKPPGPSGQTSITIEQWDQA